MIDMIDPDNGDLEVIFEGYFESENLIKPVEGSEELEGNLQLVKVKDIGKAMEKARGDAEEE